MHIFGFGIQELAMFIVLALVVAFYIAMLKHLLAQKNKGGVYKLIWAGVIIFVPITGPALYYWFNVTGQKA